MSFPGPDATAMQNAVGAIETAFGQTVYIYNRSYSGTPTAANFNELPALTIASGAYTALVTSPSEKDFFMEAGTYIDEYRQFHVASGAVANFYDLILLAGTGDYFTVSNVCSWYVQGGQIRQRILGRRVKVS